VASCSLHPGGLFNAYEAIARLERLDAVLHLGDYIYEYGAAPNDYGMAVGAKLGRVPEPAREIVSLADYRQRHAQYKADPDLQAAHARAPWICVWDDHESANDCWVGAAENHDEGEGDWASRKAAALQAYYEWMPIREPQAGGMREAINRSFDFGDVATLMMVETRLLARTQPLELPKDMPMTTGPDGKPRPDLQAFAARLNAPDRQLMGAAQEAWLGSELKRSRAEGRRWQVLGNQVIMARVRIPDAQAMMTPEQWSGVLAGLDPDVAERVRQAVGLAKLGVPMSLDSWDGYPAVRERVYAMVKEAKASAITLTGDSHAFWVNELKDASGQRVGAEFGTTAVTSPSWGDAMPGFDLGKLVAAGNEEVVLNDQRSKGFLKLTLTREAATAELIAVSTHLAKPFTTRTVATYRVTPGTDGGVSAPTAASA
jgi:alkaline phosphatase D